MLLYNINVFDLQWCELYIRHLDVRSEFEPTYPLSLHGNRRNSKIQLHFAQIYKSILYNIV
jgi:hypothetical protein